MEKRCRRKGRGRRWKCRRRRRRSWGRRRSRQRRKRGGRRIRMLGKDNREEEEGRKQGDKE